MGERNRPIGDVYGSLLCPSALVRLRALIAVCAQCLIRAPSPHQEPSPPCKYVARAPSISPFCLPPPHHPQPLPMTCPIAVPTLQAEPLPPCCTGRSHTCSASRRRDENVAGCQCTSLLLRRFASSNRRPATTPNPTGIHLTDERSRSPLSIGALHFSRDDNLGQDTMFV